MVYINGILELALHRPAPFWISSDVETYNCLKGYAAPAANNSIAVAFMFNFWLTFSFGPEPRPCHNWLKRSFTLTIILCVTWILIFAHQYNGNASLD